MKISKKDREMRSGKICECLQNKGKRTKPGRWRELGYVALALTQRRRLTRKNYLEEEQPFKLALQRHRPHRACVCG